MNYTIQRKMLAAYGWRWCVLKGSQLVCHADLFVTADRIRAGLDTYEPPVEAKPLTQADIEGRPPGFIPQGSLRQLLWNAGKDSQRAA